jgi:hypothetical protein
MTNNFFPDIYIDNEGSTLFFLSLSKVIKILIGEERDLISSFLTARELLESIPHSANHIGNV